MADTRACPVAGCNGHVDKGKLMCRECWEHVTSATRAEVTDAWRSFMKYSRRRISELAGLGEARDRYELARAAALREACNRFAGVARRG